MNRLARVPERAQENMRLASLHPAQDVHPPISCAHLYRRQASDTLLLYGGTLRRRLHFLHRDSYPQGFQPSDQSLPLGLDVHAIEVVGSQFLIALPTR